MTQVGNQEFVALDDLASAFQLIVREESGAITVSYRGRTIVLTPERALASVAGRLVSLPAPATRVGGRWVVPLEFINRALALVYDARLVLSRPSHLVVIGDIRVPRVMTRYEPLANATRLTIDATPSTASRITQETNRLVIRFEADALDFTIPAFQPQDLVQAIRMIDPVTVAVDLGPRFASFRASTETVDNTTRLVLEVLATPTATSASPSAPAPPPRVDLPVFGDPAPSIRTIAIDPGHGGDDAGARSAEGAVEKDLTLAAARRLKTAIESRLGIRVLLTRDDDRDVPLDRRTAVANNNKADVFISLHANGSVRSSATGATIYVAAFDDRQQAPMALARERVAVFGGGVRDIEVVPWDLAQIRYISQSAELGRLLKEHLHDRVPLEVGPIDRASFRVLESANMPAILVEMGYLTNADQAKLLMSGEFQTSFVQAVFDSVVRFRAYLAGTAGEL